MSALASRKQKHKVVMCCLDTVLYLQNSLNLIKTIRTDICAFQEQISCCSSGKKTALLFMQKRIRFNKRNKRSVNILQLCNKVSFAYPPRGHINSMKKNAALCL